VKKVVWPNIGLAIPLQKVVWPSLALGKININIYTLLIYVQRNSLKISCTSVFADVINHHFSTIFVKQAQSHKSKKTNYTYIRVTMQLVESFKYCSVRQFSCIFIKQAKQSHTKSKIQITHYIKVTTCLIENSNTAV